MDFCFGPIQRERFHCRRNNPFVERMMRRNCENTFRALDEEFAFPSEFYHPFFMRSHSLLVPRRRFFQKEEECKEASSSENQSENTAEEKQSGVETSSTLKLSKENEEKSLQKRENLCKNLFHLGEMFPSFDKLASLLNTDEDGPFQVNVNLHGCDPDKIKVEIKDGVLKVEGRKETTEGSFTYVRHEQTIPKSVSTRSLKASLHPEGVLTIRQEKECLNIPVTMETDEKVAGAKENENLARQSEE